MVQKINMKYHPLAQGLYLTINISEWLTWPTPNLYVRGDEVLVTQLWHRWVSQEAFVAAAPDDYLLILFQLLIERKGTF